MEIDLQPHRQSINLDELPIISLQPFCGEASDKSAKQACAAELRDACIQAGFFYLVDHGVSEDLRAKMFERTKQLFEDLTHEEKQTMDATRNRLYRGYISEACGAHTCNPGAASGKDAKQSFTVGAENVVGKDGRVAYTSPMHGPNEWPDEEKIAKVHGFRSDVQSYFDECTSLARRLARALALSLEQEESYFEDCLRHPCANMVLLRYSLTEPKGLGVVGCGEHTDCGFLTILMQDQVGGLQVKHSDGRWIDAPVVPGSFVVNLGDMAQRWSNDLYKSTWHRVRTPTEGPRFSVPFFCNCDFETEVECVTTASDASKFDTITAGEYILRRLNLMRLVERPELPELGRKAMTSSTHTCI